MKHLPKRYFPALIALFVVSGATSGQAATAEASPSRPGSLSSPRGTDLQKSQEASLNPGPSRESAKNAQFLSPPSLALPLSSSDRIAHAETSAEPAPAAAQTQKQALGQQALDFFAKRHKEVVSLVKSKSSTDKLAKLVDDLIDYRELSQAALGGSSRYQSQCKNKCAEFESALGELIRRNYLRFIRQADGHNLEYLGAKVGRKGTAVKIDTKVKTKKKGKAATKRSEVQVSYVLKKRGTQNWAVVDIITEGVSLRKTYRHEFEQIMAKPGAQGGIEGIIAQIRKKLVELSASKAGRSGKASNKKNKLK